MRLEEAIKQSKPFHDEHEKVIVNLLYTHSWLSQKMKAHFKCQGITGKQYNILRILQGAGRPVSNSFIRERLLDKLSDVSRIVDRMAEGNLVEKSQCHSDKRLIDVRLTTTGLEILKKLGKKQTKLNEMMGNLTEKEAKTLNGLLDKLRDK